MHHNKGKRK